MLQDNMAAMAYTGQRSPTQSVEPAHGLDALGLVAAMDAATERWHVEPADGEGMSHVMALHRANFDLWHLEDDARSATATAVEIAAIKRSIDRVNQVRNDHAEAVDVELLATLATAELPRAEAPLHSETPGQMLDRLSILSLKRFHTDEESRRETADEAHRERNAVRLAILREQTIDLSDCLQELWMALLQGQRRFKRYRQLKMYNDPDLNPVLYRVGHDR